MFVILLGILVCSSTVQSELEEEFSNAIQSGFGKSIISYFMTNQEKISQLFKKPLLVQSLSYPRQLTPEIINKALLNLKQALPEDIPMIPFAVAEPIKSNDILFYFGILNSCFKNLTEFSCDSEVQNTVSSSSIGVNLHLNISSLEGHYELDVSNYNMHLYGEGDYRITTNGTDAAFLTNINIFMDNSFKMTDFIFNISINSARVTMTNLLGGDPSAYELTDEIGDRLPAEVATLNEEFQQTVNSSVVEFINTYIASTMSWSNFVAAIYDLADM